MGQIILAALVAYLMQILASCNDTSWINMEFFHRPVTLNLTYRMLIKMIPRILNRITIGFNSLAVQKVPSCFTLFLWILLTHLDTN